MQLVRPINIDQPQHTTSRKDWLRWIPTPSFLHIMSFLIVAVVLLPLVYLVIRALGAGQEGLDYLLRERTLRIIMNSVKLVIAVTCSTALLGVPFAWLTARTDLPLRRFWLIGGLLTMVIPSYLGALTFVAVLGPKGILQGWLEPFGIDRLPEIYGFTGAWLAITLFTYPYVVLPVRAALLNMDPAQEEAACSLGISRWKVFIKITLPQLRPALAAGMLLTSLYTLSDFGAVATMRYNVFTRAIYQQYTSSFNRERAAVLALVLVVFTLALLILERRMSSTTNNYRVGMGARRKIKPIKLGYWRIPALIFSSSLVGLGVGLPVATMFHWAINRTNAPSFSTNMSELTQNTVGVSFLAALIIGFLAIPLGMLAIRSTGRFTSLLIGSSYIGNALPGIVIGLTLVFFGIRYLPAFYQEIPLLIMGYAIRFLPFSVGATRSALTQVNPRYEEAAKSLGISSWQITWRITLPLIRTGILGGVALVFLSVMKELPTTLMLSPLGFRTLATRIWSVQEEAMYILIGVPGLLLIIVSALSLILILWRDERTAG